MKIRSYVSRAMARERVDSWHASVGLLLRRPSLRIDRCRKGTLERNLEKCQLAVQRIASSSQSRDLLRFTFKLSDLRVIRRLSHSDHKSSALSRIYFNRFGRVVNFLDVGPPVQICSFIEARNFSRANRIE